MFTARAVELGRVLFGRAFRRAGGDWVEADDFVQEALTEAWVQWETFGRMPPKQQLAWLDRVMNNKMVDHWRKKGNRMIYPVADVPDSRKSASAEYVALNQDALRQFDEVIMRMPPAQRKVAVLTWDLGLTTDQIAELLGIVPATVRVHRMRALRQLNEDVRPEVPFIDDGVDDDEGADKREEA